MAWVAVGVGGATLLGGSMFGSSGASDAAKASQWAAQAREASMRGTTDVAMRQERGQQEFSRGIAQQGRDGIAAANSPEELNALTQSFATQERSLAKQSKLFDSIDPAIMEASQQALQLLRGEDAKSLAPIREQRKQERQALLDNLREQLGPGAETSTAGIQALNQFDQQTTQTLSGAQQGSLGQLFGMASSGAQSRSAMNQGSAMLAQIGQGFGQRAGRISGAQFNAQQGNLGANNALQASQQNILTARNAAAGAAGSQFVGAQMRGQAQMQQGSQIAGIGGSILGAGVGSMGGGGGKKTPINNQIG